MKNYPVWLLILWAWMNAFVSVRQYLDRRRISKEWMEVCKAAKINEAFAKMNASNALVAQRMMDRAAEMARTGWS